MYAIEHEYLFNAAQNEPQKKWCWQIEVNENQLLPVGVKFLCCSLAPDLKKKHVNEQISLITIITYETYDSLCVMSLHKHNTASVAEWLDRRFK